jgi:hypothetical protein
VIIAGDSVDLNADIVLVRNIFIEIEKHSSGNVRINTRPWVADPYL